MLSPLAISLWKSSLIAILQVETESADEHLPSPSSDGVLTALDPRNRRGRRADPSRQLCLRQAKLATTFDDESGERVVGRESFVLGSELRVLEGLLNVIGHGRPDGAIPLLIVEMLRPAPPVLPSHNLFGQLDEVSGLAQGLLELGRAYVDEAVVGGVLDVD